MSQSTTVNPGYALAQLAQALETSEHHTDAATRERAAKKVERWRQVLEGMTTGSLAVGSRTPAPGAPAWATLEVARGGFATGALLAGGELLAHETSLLDRIAAPNGQGRAALNLHFLSDAGRAELADLLRSGCYRVQVPEEGALLVVTWLLANGHAERAQDVLDAIVSFLDRLRFYPVPDPRPLVPSAFVKLNTVSEVARAFDETRVQKQVERMNEALRVWAPLCDRAVSLFLETVEGATPTFRTDERGALVRRPDGQPYTDGGWPCRHYPAGWTDRAKALLSDYAAARARHSLCGKPEKAGETFAFLRRCLELCAIDPRSLTGRDVGLVRKVLASFVTSHGAPGSERHAQLRAVQSRVAARPTNRELARVVAARLRKHPPDAGLESPDETAAPVSEAEAAAHHVPAGHAIPASFARKLVRCVEAPIEQLVERGVIPSSEVLARVLPQVTSHVRAAGIADPDLARLYGAIYAAFRRRRSLLLLDLQSQVKLDELPWIAAIRDFRSTGLDTRAAAHRTLSQVTTLAVTSFPQTILPNKLLQEMRALVQDAGLQLPLVDELAADIFMGTFSGKFVEAAKITARVLEGTLYARYYDLPIARVLRIDDVKKASKHAAPSSADFAALCTERAGPGKGSGSHVAYNGKIIEQEQILTTHNLAPLFHALDLAPSLRGRLPELAQACFRFICEQEQTNVEGWHAKLTRVKNSAYSWRQMIFYLSLADPRDVSDTFLPWASEHLRAQSPSFQEAFTPALRGLEIAARGESLDAAEQAGTARRFLGWATEDHWLLDD